MFQAKIEFEPIRRNALALAGYHARLLNLRPLARKIEQIVIEGNRRAAAAGLDKNDDAYAPLRPSTIATRGGSGPPLAPRGAGSRVVTNFVAKTSVRRGAITVTAGWQGDTEWMQYHVTGYRHRSGTIVPARNPSGIRPLEMARIQAEVDRHFKFNARANFDVQEGV